MNITFSYSLLDRFYNVCPEQARRDFITKDFKKPFTQVAGGIDAHKVIEQRIKNKTPLPDDAKSAEPCVLAMEQRGPIQAEVSLAIDRHLRPADFWDKSVLLRGKFDAVQETRTTAFIGDWKTGKVREKEDQLELGSLMLMEAKPHLVSVFAANIWLQAGKLGTMFKFDRADKGARWAKWLGKMKKIEELDPSVVWERREGPLCNWCIVSDCVHWKGATK